MYKISVSKQDGTNENYNGELMTNNEITEEKIVNYIINNLNENSGNIVIKEFGNDIAIIRDDQIAFIECKIYYPANNKHVGISKRGGIQEVLLRSSDTEFVAKRILWIIGSYPGQESEVEQGTFYCLNTQQIKSITNFESEVNNVNVCSDKIKYHEDNKNGAEMLRIVNEFISEMQIPKSIKESICNVDLRLS